MTQKDLLDDIEAKASAAIEPKKPRQCGKCQAYMGMWDECPVCRYYQPSGPNTIMDCEMKPTPPDSKYREIADMISGAIFSAGKRQKELLSERIESALSLAAETARAQAVEEVLKIVSYPCECGAVEQIEALAQKDVT